MTTGGSGFGVMAIIVGVARGWIGRAEAVERLQTMVRFLLRADSYHGILPHFLNGDTGKTVPSPGKMTAATSSRRLSFWRGLLCARQYFDREDDNESRLRTPDQLAVGGGGVELAHAGRPQRALLALEPEQRLEHEP